MSPEEAVFRVAQAREALLGEVHKVIIGQDEMIEQMLICIFARGNCLTIGVPGLAKTLTVSTLAKALAMRFSRIQFTPDLMPSDITGTEIIDQDAATGQRTFRFVHGPVFVMATQNPIEQEGTYPLPEAQLDRFMLSINIGYPTRSEERQIVMATTQAAQHEIRPVLRGQDILWIQQLVRQVPTTQHMVDYAVDLVRATRPKEPPSPDFVKNWLAWGAGPRAAQNIILTSKARVILHGRYSVTAEDIRAMAFPVLRHRIFTNFNADAEGIDVEQVIEKILETVPEPSYGEKVSVPARAAKQPAAESQAAAAQPPTAMAPSQSPAPPQSPAPQPAAAPVVQSRPAVALQPTPSVATAPPPSVPTAPPQTAYPPPGQQSAPPSRGGPTPPPTAPTPPPTGPTPPPTR